MVVYREGARPPPFLMTKLKTRYNNKKSNFMNDSKIAYTEGSWNPITGCTKCSAACAHCYAERMAIRLHAMGNPSYVNGFKVTTHPNLLDDPKKYKKGKRIFVCTMADLFHEDVPDDFIDKVMDTIRATPQHTYQILTKRSNRMAEYFSTREIPDNVWLGVTVENKASLYRIEDLKKCAAQKKWLSCEPLLEDLTPDIDLTGINWVVCGGETGPGCRRMMENWAWNLKLASDNAGAAFFFKQWGDIGPDGVRRGSKNNGCLLKGKEYKNYP